MLENDGGQRARHHCLDGPCRRGAWGAVGDDKVKALVYVAAFAPPKGASINDLAAGQPPPPWAAALKPATDISGWRRHRQVFLAGPSGQGNQCHRRDAGAGLSGVFDERLATTAYETKSSWYVVANHDGMIPPAAEAAMAKAIGAKVTKLSTSRVAMLSNPREVADSNLAAAASVKVAISPLSAASDGRSNERGTS
jgi:hypothetical protein